MSAFRSSSSSARTPIGRRRSNKIARTTSGGKKSFREPKEEAFREHEEREDRRDSDEQNHGEHDGWNERW